MAAYITEMEKHLQSLVSQTSRNLMMVEVTDHFDLMQELGKGSYGRIFMGKHKHSGQVVAIKLMAKEKTPVDRFLQEYGISLTLRCHPHIIFIHEIVFQTSRDFGLILELAPAGNLDSIIKPTAGMQEDMWKRCVLQIASALDFMHSRGLVHRDLKMNNILLMDAECHWIKLADFGFTRLQGTCVSSLSRCKPHHAPELCSLRKGDQLVLHPSLDTWAFGVLIYGGVTGFYPWHHALTCDQHYKDFAWWQLRMDILSPPEMWKTIDVEAVGMFWDLLAIDASERSSVMDVVMKYIHRPWKVEDPSQQGNRNSMGNT